MRKQSLDHFYYLQGYVNYVIIKRQKFYDELAEKYDMSNVRHPRIEDYEVEIER